MTDTNTEMPWPHANDGWLNWDGGAKPEDGSFWFRDPAGQLCRISVNPNETRADMWEVAGEQRVKQHVWHAQVNGEWVTISPSIHFIGTFHTPNPVTFRLVEKQEIFDE
jgi:hypothetical protein